MLSRETWTPFVVLALSVAFWAISAGCRPACCTADTSSDDTYRWTDTDTCEAPITLDGVVEKDVLRLDLARTNLVSGTECGLYWMPSFFIFQAGKVFQAADLVPSKGPFVEDSEVAFEFHVDEFLPSGTHRLEFYGDNVTQVDPREPPIATFTLVITRS